MYEAVAKGIGASAWGAWRAITGRKEERKAKGTALDAEAFAQTVMTQFGELVNRHELHAPEPVSQKKKEAEELKVRAASCS